MSGRFRGSAMMSPVLTERISQWGEATLGPPATETALTECEEALGEPLPGDLRSLLAEANGVTGEYGLGLVWDLQRIGAQNVWIRSDADMRELYLPFEGLVFFADAGNGDQFAISQRANHEIYVWNHEDDSRTWVAPAVIKYLEWWMTGVISV
jgi:SMI1/KNR4 family protein SUKH-1